MLVIGSLVTVFLRTFASLEETNSACARRRLLASPTLEKLQINHFVGSARFWVAILNGHEDDSASDYAAGDYIAYANQLPTDTGEARSSFGLFRDMSPHDWLFVVACGFAVITSV